MRLKWCSVGLVTAALLVGMVWYWHAAATSVSWSYSELPPSVRSEELSWEKYAEARVSWRAYRRLHDAIDLGLLHATFVVATAAAISLVGLAGRAAICTVGKASASVASRSVAALLVAACAAAAAAAEPGRGLRVVVLDPDGKPLPGANVHAGIWTDEKDFTHTQDRLTDAAGAARVELPKTFKILRLWASKDPFVTMFVNWEQAELSTFTEFPAEYTVRLESPTQAAGRVVDVQGQPIAGAKVEVRVANDPRPAGDDGRVRYTLKDTAVVTDAAGRWAANNVPNHPEVELAVLVSHPDYVGDTFWRDPPRGGPPMSQYRDGSATLTLKSGVVVTGRVTDPDGKPVKDAVVIHGEDPYAMNARMDFLTDADGRFRLPALVPHGTTLTVIAPGWAPQERPLDVRPGLAPQEIRLAAGKPIRLRIVDGAGKPLPKAYVGVDEWQGKKALHTHKHPSVHDTRVPNRADENGVYEWAWAPQSPVKFSVQVAGASAAVVAAGGEPEQTVVLKGPHIVTGRVTDAGTGQPIPAFTVVPVNVFRGNILSDERGKAETGRDGALKFLVSRDDHPQRLRVEAMGYRTVTGREFKRGDDDAQVQDFALEPAAPVAGRVVDANGQPVANAEVLMATPTGQASLESNWDNLKTTTDANGRFRFAEPGEPFTLIARSDVGFARGDGQASELKLRPWAAVTGRFRDGGKPVAGAWVLLSPIRVEDRGWPIVDDTMRTQTDGEGRFSCARVPPGPVAVKVLLGPWEDPGYRSGPAIPLELTPGRRAELDLGNAGATVTGRVMLTGPRPAGLDCAYSLNTLYSREPAVPAPPGAEGFDIRQGYRASWLRTLAGQAYLMTVPQWFVKLAPDGSFRVSGVPAGEYELVVSVYAKPSGCLTDPLAQAVVRMSVSDADVKRGEVSVPDVTAEVRPVAEVGTTPTLAFHKADGLAGTLADVRGKPTLVHFWASWCAPCKRQLPAVARLHETAAGINVVGLSLDEDVVAWQAALNTLTLPWPQGRVANPADAGLSSVPAYWLLDGSGTIVAKAYDADELPSLIEKYFN